MATMEELEFPLTDEPSLWFVDKSGLREAMCIQQVWDNYAIIALVEMICEGSCKTL